MTVHPFSADRIESNRKRLVAQRRTPSTDAIRTVGLGPTSIRNGTTTAEPGATCTRPESPSAIPIDCAGISGAARPEEESLVEGHVLRRRTEFGVAPAMEGGEFHGQGFRRTMGNPAAKLGAGK